MKTLVLIEVVIEVFKVAFHFDQESYSYSALGFSLLWQSSTPIDQVRVFLRPERVPLDSDK